MAKTSQASRAVRRIIAHEYFPLAVLIAVNIFIAALIFTDYGESWDEHLRFRDAERALAAYSGDRKSLNDSGTSYIMLARLGSDAFRLINAGLHPIEAWHIVHFWSFLLGLFFLYMLCLKYFDKWAALGTVLLFNTQPLLWGHAFINPKDIPFMAFFLGSVAMGMNMVDHCANLFTDPTSQPVRLKAETTEALLTDAARISQRRKYFFVILIGIAACIPIALQIFSSGIQDYYAGIIADAYQPNATGFLSRLFSRLAENRQTIPVDFYIQKADAWYSRLINLYIGLLLILTVFLAVRLFPATSAVIWRSTLKPFLTRIGRSLTSPRILAAGAFLGFCTSIRILGPASGLLIGVYMLLKCKWKGLPVLVAYGGIALLVAYLTWPYLWPNPMGNLLNSLTVASDFPWEGKVLFAGIEYPASALPRSYLPTLLTLQTPELTLLLFLFGLVVVAIGIVSHKADWDRWLIAALWFFAPFLSVLILNPNMYDNFRQFIFILPAAFLFAGAGLHWILDRVRRPAFSALIIAVLILPNIASLVRLHPYQYTYYNSLVGGLRGAFRSYDTDYWATSYREAAEFLNANAPPNSLVEVVGPSIIVEHYARPDLRISEYSASNPILSEEPFYAVILTRHNKDQALYPDALPVFSIGRDQAVFSIIKFVTPETRSVLPGDRKSLSWCVPGNELLPASTFTAALTSGF